MEATKMYPYTFTVETAAEWDALQWASARWEGARVLYDLGHLAQWPGDSDDWDGESFPVTLGYEQWEAWQVQTAIEEEDAGFIPCLCDSLNDRIMTMLGRIV